MKHFVIIASGLMLVWLLVVWKGTEKVKSTEQYQKLFASKHNDLIIGTSRAARLNPGIINKNYSYNFLNYAFNLTMSPYSSEYRLSIVNKVDFKSPEKGVFIICVDPWALSEKIKPSKHAENVGKLLNFDDHQFMATVRYFLQTYSKPYYTLFLPEKEEENFSKRPDSLFIKRHLAAKISSYEREHFSSESISDNRLSNLSQLIDTLKTKGEVYLVKLPVSSEMIDLEQRYAPAFDARMLEISETKNIGWINFYPYASNFLCPDGNHLWIDDANNVSLIIADLIVSHKKDPETSTSYNLLRKYVNNKNARYKQFLIDKE